MLSFRLQKGKSELLELEVTLVNIYYPPCGHFTRRFPRSNLEMRHRFYTEYGWLSCWSVVYFLILDTFFKVPLEQPILKVNIKFLHVLCITSQKLVCHSYALVQTVSHEYLLLFQNVSPWNLPIGWGMKVSVQIKKKVILYFMGNSVDPPFIFRTK